MTRPIDALRSQRADIEARHAQVLRQDRKQHYFSTLSAMILAGVFVLGVATLDVDWSRVPAGLLRLGEFAWLMIPPEPGSYARAVLYAQSLGETLAIALLGTLTAAVLAFPMGFLAAKNVIANRIVHFLARRSLDTIRGIDVLVWALIWVSVVGLGPFAGILAIACSDFGTFGKLFSEAIETADHKPVEGVIASGGSKLQSIHFGILPQVLPVMASHVLYFFESNTRSATIIGIVGAGGIGLHLSEQIRTLEWQHVSFIVILILLAVASIDFISSRLRFAIIGRKQIAA
jgi:phosphonate transport system permease protein